jgi:hypothetical protein
MLPSFQNWKLGARDEEACGKTATKRLLQAIENIGYRLSDRAGMGLLSFGWWRNL